MSNEDKTPIGSSEENRIVPDQEDNANIVADPLLCYESAASLIDNSELSGMDCVMSDQTFSLNEDNMVTPVQRKANIVSDPLLCDESAAGLFDDSELSGMDYVMSDQTVSLNEENMVTPVHLKANIVVDPLLRYAAGLFDVYRSVEMSDQTVILNEDIMVSPIQEKVADDDSLLWRESADVIFDNCHAAEKSRPVPLEKIASDPRKRAVLIDWLVEMCDELKLQTDTLYISVNLIDWFFSTSNIEVERYQLLGITCLLIASKYEEIGKLRVKKFCLDTEDAYRSEQIIDMEEPVLKCVQYHLVDPTTYTFLRMFLVVAKASPKLQCMSSFLAELSLLSQKFEPYLPSRVAASALFLARWTLDPSQNPWDKSLEQFTTYKAQDLKIVVVDLQALQRQIEYRFCATIHNKYSKPKFQNVAALFSKNLDDAMFDKEFKDGSLI